MAKDKIQSTANVVNPQELLQILAVSLKLNRPIFIWGAPGLGKSAIVRQATAQWLNIKPEEIVDTYNHAGEAGPKRNLIDFRANNHVPEDGMGLPWNRDGWTRFRPTELLS